MKSYLTRFMLVSLAALSLSACAPALVVKTYDDPQVGLGESAVLHVDDDTYVSAVGAYQTGVSVRDRLKIPTSGTQFSIKPGSHKIEFDYFSSSSSSTTIGVPTKSASVTHIRSTANAWGQVLVHDFKKGHKYELHYRPDGEKLNAKIVDVTDGGARAATHTGWAKL